jgi:FixJ family two-component response regulator
LSTEPLFAIVDDDEAVRQALSELLEVSGWRCLTFSNAPAFIAAHAPGRYAAVVTDLNLPGQSGLQLQHHLRCVEPSLPVIVISAQSDPGVRARCLASGAVAYLTKPIGDEMLLVHLAAAAGRG